jgi:hypothetical protein
MPGVAEMPGAAETPDLGAAEPASTPPRRKWRPPPGGLPTITFSPEGLAAWPQPQPPPGRAGDADGAEVQPDFPPETTTADDHHPLPPPQDSGDGHL